MARQGATWGGPLRWGILAVYWGLLFVATHIPKIPDGLEPGVGDKWMHTIAYAGLAVLLAFAVACARDGSGRLTLKLAGGLWLTCALYGIVDEVLQGFVSRQPDIRDWGADLLGSAAGVVIYGGLASVWLWCCRGATAAPAEMNDPATTGFRDRAGGPGHLRGGAVAVEGSGSSGSQGS